MDQQDRKAFKKLQKQWYSKIKETGFKDIEQEDGQLQTWASHFFKTHSNPTLMEAKQKYYEMAAEFLHTFKFKDDIERAIWELHVEAISIRKIDKILQLKGMKVYKWYVQKTIQALAKKMMEKKTSEKA